MLRAIEQYLSKTASIVAHFVLFLFFVRFFIIEPGVVDGQSMEPNFWDNQVFMVNKVTPLLSSPKRLEVVQLFPPQARDRLIIKRIIGLPGETVSIKRNAVYIRNSTGYEFELSEPYLYENIVIKVPYGASQEFFIPDNSYFVLGDNRIYSGDSREFGVVHRNRIVGKVLAL